VTMGHRGPHGEEDDPEGHVLPLSCDRGSYI
jgi:hypothetical protein